MLGLKLYTDPRWVNIAEKSLEEILTDHAFCEQKAATSGISIIVKYSEEYELVKEMTALVAEEWGHFRKVLKELDKRGLKLGRQRNDEYVVKLLKFPKRGTSRSEILVDKLLLNGMIEARSCERFRLLSLHITDNSLKEFYHEFMVSEAGHYRMFLDMAKTFMPLEYVKNRWAEIIAFEETVLSSIELRGDRVH